MLSTGSRISFWGFAVSLCVTLANAADTLDLSAVRDGFTQHCSECHNAETAEGEVRFDNLGDIPLVNQLAILNRAQDQLFFELMPPQLSADLSTKQRATLSSNLRSLLQRHGASDLDARLSQPAYGNFVDHEVLFSGDVQDAAFTPARRWLVSPQIFHEKVNDVFKLERQARQRKFYGVTNPIVLPDNSGVRYFDSTTLDGGHLLMMLNNANWISKKQIFSAVNDGVGRAELVFENQKDRWYPAKVPEAFIRVVKKGAKPTKAEMAAAIQAQFDCVLRRSATQNELARYLDLLATSIAVGGNIEGLRQVLVSVLLESEFLYRLEFGHGESDKHGRKRLSGTEASYAIAYALSDRGPDEELREAARTGKLVKRNDYRREVNRILNDKNSHFAEISPTVSSGYVKPHKSTHPKIVRFFREFFGYPNSMKLFKDMARSGGFFDNAGRDYTGTAGSVTNEADRVVDDVLKADQHVFERLLTTNEFYVLHPRSNEEGTEIVESWRHAYAELKGLDWRNNTEQVLADNFDMHQDAFKAIRITQLTHERKRVNVRDFKRFMEYFENTFDRGITPITFPWFYHGGQKFRYSEIYSLPRVPGGGPIGASGKYRKDLAWDYPVKQPFKVQNRMGILTHPAWLLAHSQNTETDIVRRGRWIREKLLAGRVPDVPITVDAQVPEDHELSLRGRLESVTSKQECWKCHRQMNPLGVAFEVFDDFGRYRTEESLEAPENLIQKGNGKTSADVFKTKPVNAKGYLEGTGDPKLDGEVEHAFDLIERLSKSERVRQSIIRHAFRFFMGRNEMVSDSKTLTDADRAYVESSGSFNAVIVSLLTSDSFLYRKPVDR
ncbi:DUF1588 domain-containing protein [bacterium]|nr:DUF1588 domain-containing protein [bacterium]